MTIAALTQKLSTVAIGALIAVAAMNNAAHAATFTESGDAGETLGTAQSVGGGINQISGFLSSGTADLYSFYFDGGIFSASTVGLTDVDTQLFLFDVDGFGIVASDGVPGDSTYFPSAFSETLSAGQYFLGLSAYDNDPVSEGGEIFIDGSAWWNGEQTPTGVGAGQPLTGFNGGGSGGAYSIAISTTATQPVPEPASLMALMAVAGAGATLLKRKSVKASAA